MATVTKGLRPELTVCRIVGRKLIPITNAAANTQAIAANLLPARLLPASEPRPAIGLAPAVLNDRGDVEYWLTGNGE